MYRDQSLFGDLLKFAHDNGFHFAGFTYLQDVMPRRTPIGLRSKGFLSFGDCVFLRSIESLKETCKDNGDFALKAWKLSFLAVAFGYLPYALEVLDQAAA